MRTQLLSERIDSVHTIAAFMKTYMSRSPISLLPFEAFTETKKIKWSDPAIAVDTLKRTLSDDSAKEKRSILRRIVKFLVDVDKEPSNGVHSFDLASAVGPSLCKPQRGAYMSLLHIGGLKVVKVVTQHLIERYSDIFSDDEESDDESAQASGEQGFEQCRGQAPARTT